MAIKKADGETQPSPAQRKGMLNAILSQTFGVLGEQAFLSGIMLVYLARQGISDSRIAFYLAIPFGVPVISIYLAHQSDRKGKKLFGLIGSFLIVAGYFVILLSSFIATGLTEAVTVSGIVLYAIGISFFNCSWFGLMHPLVPGNMRGRFWGRLRLSWQSVSIIFAIFAGFFLSDEAPLYIYQIVLGAITLFMILRICFYASIPEIEKQSAASERFLPSLIEVIRIPGLLPFSAYVFLLALSMGAGPTLFGLIEKKVLHLSDGAIVLMGATMMSASVLGYWLGGKAVDRFGTKPAFLTCHVGLGTVLLLFSFRSIFPFPLIWTLGILNGLYGMFFAVSSIAITTEMYVFVRDRSQSLSTSFCSTMVQLGRSLSGVIVSVLLTLGLLRPKWEFGSVEFSQYDSILMLLGTLILLLIITLGLVPSVMGSSET